MIETIVTNLLTKYLGQYIEGLNNLNISLAQGEAVLKNLALRRSALDDFELPVTVLSGYVGELRLRIPWRELKKKHAVIEIKDVYLLAGPTVADQFDASAHNERVQTTKQRMLQFSELLEDEVDDKTETKKDDSGFFATAGAAIVNNVQVYIKNVHLRYQDNTSGSQFGFGITLEHLHAQSTDSGWKPTFVTDTNVPKYFKFVSLRNLAVYWNPYSPAPSVSSMADVGEFLKCQIHTDSNPQPHLRYLLQPVSASMHITIDNRDKVTMDVPKILVELLCNDISFVLDELQYRDMLSLFKFFHSYSKSIKYLRFRPQSHIEEEPREWWQFAIKSLAKNTTEANNKKSWAHMKGFIHDKRRYIRLYAKKKISRSQKNMKLNEKELAELQALEYKHDIEHLVLFRQLATAFVKKDQQHRAQLLKEKKSEREAKSTGFFSKLLDKINDDPKVEGLALTSNVMKELHTSLGTDSDKQTVVLPKEYVQHKFRLDLLGGSITLQDEGSNRLVKGAFTGMDVLVLHRDGSMSVSADVQAVLVTDYFTEGTRFPMIVSPVGQIGGSSSEKVFHGSFDWKPLDDPIADFSVKIKTMPLNVVVTRPLLRRIFDFFAKPVVQLNALHDLELIAYMKLQELRKQTEQQLQSVLDNKRNIAVSLDVQAPNIIVPQNPLSQGSPVLALLLGRLQLASQLAEGGATEEDVDDTVLYNKYKLSLTTVQALVATADLVDLKRLHKSSEKHQLVQPFDVNLDLGISRIHAADKFPKVKVEASLPSLRGFVSSSKISSLLLILDTVALGAGEEEAIAAATSPQVVSDLDNIVGQATTLIKHADESLSKAVPADLLAPTQRQVVVSFAVPSVELYIEEEGPPSSECTILLEVQLRDIRGELEKTSYDMRLSALLHEAFVLDRIQQEGHQFRHFVSSDIRDSGARQEVVENMFKSAQARGEDEHALILINYLGIPTDSPMFQGVAHDISTRFNMVHLMFHMVTVQRLLSFTTDILDTFDEQRWKPPKNSEDNSRVARATDSEDTVRLSQDFPVAKIAAKQPPSGDFTLVNIKAELDAVGISLVKRGRPIVEAYIGRSQLEVAVSSTDLVNASGGLGAMTIDYLDEDFTLHPHIMTIDGKELIRFGVEYRLGDDLRAEELSLLENAAERGLSGPIEVNYDAKLSVELSSVQFVYVQRFVTEMANYFKLDTSAASYALAKAEQLQQAAATLDKRLSLEIHVSNPIVLLPCSINSPDLMRADLGAVDISNCISLDYIDATDCESGLTFKECFTVEVTSMNLQTGQSRETAQVLISDVDLRIDAVKPVKALNSSLMSEMAVSVIIPEISVDITENQVEQIHRTVRDNICEAVASIPSPGPVPVSPVESSDALEKASNSPQAPVSDDIELFSTMTVAVQLNVISVRVSSGTGYREDEALCLSSENTFESPGHKPYTTVVINGNCQHLRAFVDMVSDDSMSVEVSIAAVVVRDLRSSVENYFSDIFTPRLIGGQGSLPAQQPSQIRVSYSANKERQLVNVLVNHPYVMVVPGVWEQVLLMTMKLKDQLLEMSDLLIKFVDDFNNQLEGKNKPLYPESFKEMDVAVSVLNAEFCLIQDVSKANSPALVCRSTVDVKYVMPDTNWQTIGVQLSKAQVYKCRMSDMAGTRTLLVQPFGLQLTYDNDDKQRNTKVSLTVSAVDATVSYRDAMLAMAIYESSKPKLLMEEAERVKNEAKNKGDDGKTVAPTVSASPEATLNQSLIICTNGVRVVLIDDILTENRHNPLMMYQLIAFDGRVTDWTENIQTFVEGRVAVDFYNGGLEVWEPMLEPFVFQANVNQLDKETVVAITSPGANLNISKSFVESVLNTIDTITDTKQTLEPVEEIATDSPYFVRNDCGLDISFMTSACPVMQKLTTGEEAPLVLSKRRKGHQWMSRQQDAFQTLTVAAKDPAGRLCNTDDRLAIDKVGSYRLQLSLNAAENVATLEVAFRQGCKVVTVRSNLLVKNCCSDVIFVKFGASDARVPTAVPVGGQIAVPVSEFHTAELHIRPSGGEHKFATSTKKVKGVTAGLMVAKPIGGNPFDFYFHVRAEQLKQDKVVSIYAPLVVENLLPVDAELKVVSLAKRKTVDHTIAASGTRHNIHIVDIRAQLGLLVKLNQYGSTTTPLVLNMPAEPKQDIGKRRRLVNSVKAKVHPPSKEDDHILVRDDANRALIVRTINKVDPKTGVRTVTLFCDYWMVNKVGLRLLYKKGGEREICGGQVALEHEVLMLHRLNPNEWYSSSDEHSEHLFLHSDLGSWKGSGNKVQVKVAESQWSDSLTISSAGTSGVTTVKDFPVQRTEPVRLFELAVGVEAATEKFWRTKVVTFAPAFIVVNRSATSQLNVKQMGTGDERSSVLAPKTVLPWHWPDASCRKEIVIGYETDRYHWSTRFALGQLGYYMLKLRKREDHRYSDAAMGVPDSPGASHLLVSIELKLEKTTTLVLISDAPEFPLYRIVNDTSFGVVVKQKDANKGDVLPGKTKLDFGWDHIDSKNEHILTVAMPGAVQVEASFEVHRVIKKVAVTVMKRKHLVQLEVEPDGPTRVLRISQQSGIGRSESQDDFVIVDDPTETDNKMAPVELSINLAIDKLGISVVDETPQELLFASVEGIGCRFTQSATDQGIELWTKRLQVDNQLSSTCPILLFPMSGPDEPKFFHLSVIKNTAVKTVEHYRYIGIRVSEMDVKVTEELATRLMGFAAVISEFMSRRSMQEISKFGATSPAGQRGDKGQKSLLEASDYETDASIIYIEFLCINSIAFTFSFVSDGVASAGGAGEEIERLLPIYGRLLLACENANLKLNCLILTLVFQTRDEFIRRVSRHYAKSAVQRLYRMLGAADILGSPVNLVKNLGSGVYDFFHEPALGIVQSPAEFGSGVARGTKSLLKNSVYGIFNTTSKVTGSIGTGAAKLTFDEEYQRERDYSNARDKPKHAADGVWHGAKSFGSGLFKGISGIVTEPVKGASDGASGIAKGTLRGVTGVFMKPTVGAIDSLSKLTEGIRNTATYWDEQQRQRTRLPRYIGPDRVLRPYDVMQAQGQHVLRVLLDNGRLANQWLQCSLAVDAGLLLVTDSVMLHFDPATGTLHWEVPVAIIRGLQLTNEYILVVLSEANKNHFYERSTKYRCVASAKPLAEREDDLEQIYQSLLAVLEVLQKS